ncbi:MAG: PQQ-dependent sugar dehydrogenase [Burkholderiales bacterium]|nr:PQQ-dependent sugar dehydrogenase [Burkholderiales bacterium]
MIKHLIIIGVFSWASHLLAQVKPSTEIVAKGLLHPWAVAFLNEGRFLVTERSGRLRIIESNGRLQDPIRGLPEIESGGQGGLLDLILDKDFKSNRRIFFCYSEPGLEGNSTALASARLATREDRLEDVHILFSQRPKVRSKYHFGCRIVQDYNKNLFLTLGDRFFQKADAQTLDNHHGKIIRIREDGKIPADNPLLNRPGALPEIWSYGHRNIQGATLGLDGLLWTHEHGPQGGDEINQPLAGKNYGWPVITYGENYGGGLIGEGIVSKPGLEQPVHYWTPSIAPSGMAFINSDRYGKSWQGNLLVGSLKFRYLVRLNIKNKQVIFEEKLLPNLNQRIRDVREGPDGFIYMLTDERQGQLLRLLP